MKRAASLVAVSVALLGGTAPADAQHAVASIATWRAPELAPTTSTAARAPLIRDLRWPADSLVRVGDYRWEGALVGAVLIGTLGAVLGAGIKDACPTVPGADCDRGGLGDALLVGGAGAAAGGLVGFVVGLASPKYARVPQAGGGSGSTAVTRHRACGLGC